VSWLLNHKIAMYGTLGVAFLSIILHYSYQAYLHRAVKDTRERFRRRNAFQTLLVIFAAAIIVVLWSRLLQHTGTFLGILGAGIAIALREPLLGVAGRIAILAGGMYSLGDRIQITEIKGDVIDVGFFYTRLMEIGNWIQGDQVTGRIVQISNSQVFGAPIFNYTQGFSYIWDEAQLPVTYASNIEAASKILLDVGGDYTREFLQGAEAQLEQLRRYFLLPAFELKPSVFLTVTSNWIGLSMRYVVEPKQRRSASNFIYAEVFKRIRQRDDIQIASETMDLTVQPKKAA
jgi:small-conductance mechanosensitive channel